MSLEKYKQKRHFVKTAEYTGGKTAGNIIRLVVRNMMHPIYITIFRVEQRDIVKSLAVPKAFSMKAGERRLDMLVEDHPGDYRVTVSTPLDWKEVNLKLNPHDFSITTIPG